MLYKTQFIRKTTMMNKKLLAVFSLLLVSHVIDASQPAKDNQPATAPAASSVNPLGQPAAAAASNNQQKSDQESAASVCGRAFYLPHRPEWTPTHREEAYWACKNLDKILSQSGSEYAIFYLGQRSNGELSDIISSRSTTQATVSVAPVVAVSISAAKVQAQGANNK